MLGVAVQIHLITEEDIRLMQNAGIGWLRCGSFLFDQEKWLKGEPQPSEFFEVKETIRQLRRRGFQFMGLTPGPREMCPEAGAPGSPEYNRNFRRTCRFLTEEYESLIDWWQVANELDIWIFRDTLSLEQSVDFLKEGIRGVKEGVSSARTGINITLFPSLPGEVDGNTDRHEGIFIAQGIYGDPSLELDYAGFDSYPGTWREGGADSWHEYLESFHALTGKPLVIQEFGYASGGEMMTPEEIATGVYPCKAGKWRFSWRGAHTPEIQAQFAEESLQIFAEKPYVLGATYYSWKDANRCWQCKQPDCPVETKWGLLDRQGRAKPAYYKVQDFGRRLYTSTLMAKECAA